MGYYLLMREKLPPCFWEEAEEDQHTISMLRQLRGSFETYGVCWLVWNDDRQDLYDRRDLYTCSVVEVVEHDLREEVILPSYSLYRHRAALTLFLSAQQFEEIIRHRGPEQHCPAPARVPCSLPYFLRTHGDDPGPEPVSSFEIKASFEAITLVTTRAQLSASTCGQRQARAYPCLMFLRAASMVITQRLYQEHDPLQRQELLGVKAQLHRVINAKHLWLRQHTRYVQVTSIDLRQQEYTLRVGMHPALFEQVA
jgi:hypothetical protein